MVTCALFGYWLFCFGHRLLCLGMAFLILVVFVWVTGLVFLGAGGVYGVGVDATRGISSLIELYLKSSGKT